jgi:hypothetical protein
MRNSPWPHTYRIDPRVATGTVVSAINGMNWDAEEWKALRVAANLDDERSKTPESYAAFLKRSKAQFWSPEIVLFWRLIITTQQFYQEHQPGPGSF